MNKLFVLDYERMTGRTCKSSLLVLVEIMLRHQIRYMYYFRKYQETNSFIFRVLMYRLTKKYGLEISPTAIIGDGLYLGHPYNITVGSDVKLGKMVSLHKGCTIGQVNKGNIKGSPVIGDKVYIGINATVVGNITVGEDVMICANSFVNFNVPSHSVVVNGGSSIHHKDNATEGYI